jgi:hypothetical protein
MLSLRVITHRKTRLLNALASQNNLSVNGCGSNKEGYPDLHYRFDPLNQKLQLFDAVECCYEPAGMRLRMNLVMLAIP